MSENEQPEVDTELQQVENFARSNPSNLPPQYNGDPEKFIKSWKDMRSEITRLQQSKKAPEPQAAPAEPSEPPKAPDNLSIPSKPAAQPQPEEWNKWGEELSTTGSLSPETKMRIQQQYNVPADVVDAYVDGIKARQRALADEAAQLVGGNEELAATIQWATENLGEAERNAINSALRQPGWQNIVMGLKARRDAANTEPRSRINRSSGVPATTKPFANSKEMVAAMRDPRYKYDSEYQQYVQDRVRASGVIRDV